MLDALAVNSLPEVMSTVLGDRDGALLECHDDPDGETVAAVTGFAMTHMLEAGERLGLGDLHRLTTSGGGKASLVYLSGDFLLTAWVDPKRSITAVEKKIDEMLLSEGEML